MMFLLQLFTDMWGDMPRIFERIYPYQRQHTFLYFMNVRDTLVIIRVIENKWRIPSTFLSVRIFIINTYYCTR